MHVCTEICSTCIPAGVPNEAEVLNPVGAIPHSGADSGRNGGWTLLLLDTSEHAVNILCIHL